jgi:hypothetical protein
VNKLKKISANIGIKDYKNKSREKKSSLHLIKINTAWEIRGVPIDLVCAGFAAKKAGFSACPKKFRTPENFIRTI